jgi:hypothetical protein
VPGPAAVLLALVALASCGLIGGRSDPPAAMSERRAVWIGEQYADGLVVLGDVPPGVSTLLVVPAFEAAPPVTVKRVPSGPAPEPARLFRICDQRPGDSYPRLDQFRGPVPPELPAPRPIVAWEEATGLVPRWSPREAVSPAGWEAAAREAADDGALRDTVASAPLAFDADPEPETYAEVRLYEKATSACRFPYRTVGVLLDHDGDVVGTREVEGCFTSAPFDPMGTVTPPCAEGDGRAECRWPPDTHGGPYPAIFGPGTVPLTLAAEDTTVWIRHSWSFEGEHFLVERVDDERVVTDADAYFYHCAF